MFRKLVLLTLGLGLALSACTGSSVGDEPAAVEKIKLPMGYIPNIQFAPFYVTVDKGYFADEGIELEFDYSFETNGVEMVAAGELPLATASGEQVLLARAQGLPVVYTFTWYQQFPISVISAPELNINVPADLKGKDIGLPGLFGATYIGLEALMYSGGVTDADVTLDAIGFNQVEVFATGQKDVVVGYTSNEPIVLASQGFEVNELRVADYAELAANGIISNETTVSDNPELIRRFSRAFAKGIADAIANPDEAYEISLKYVEGLAEQDKDVQMQVLNSSIEFWKTDRIGYSNPQAWENMNRLVVQMGLIPEPVDLGKAFTNEFVP